MEFSNLSIVLAGVTGNGKSTTGNTLCGREVFKASDGAESETRICAVERYVHKTVEVCVVDTVGMADTTLTAPETLKKFSEFSDAVHAGVDVFFYIIRRDVRFAPQEDNALQAFVSNCGEGVLSHTVLVFTHCKTDQQKEEELKTWASKNSNLNKWIVRVRGVLGVENEQDPSGASDILHSKAFTVVAENSGKKYSNKALDEARLRRCHFEREAQSLSLENRPEIGRMLVDLAAGRCKHEDVEAKLGLLKKREVDKKQQEEALKEAMRRAEQESQARRWAEEAAKLEQEERYRAEQAAKHEREERLRLQKEQEREDQRRAERRRAERAAEEEREERRRAEQRDEPKQEMRAEDVGGIICLGGGFGSGALYGASLGSAGGPLGAIAGGAIGGVSGALAGTGSGMGIGYLFRRRDD